jgi:hypothetical protein
MGGLPLEASALCGPADRKQANAPVQVDRGIRPHGRSANGRILIRPDERGLVVCLQPTSTAIR